ncbi:MAG: CbiX/SirB N-terminal domain-containing protein [Gemmobacter sp.]
MTDALIVAHGAPADPLTQEAALHRLADAVAALMPGWRVRGATLAAPGALEAALAGLDRPVVFPFFMAEGWFTLRELPRRLAGAQVRQLRPFGTLPGLVALCAAAARDGAAAAGIDPAGAALLLAGHGSAVSRTSTVTTEAAAEALRLRGVFARVVTGYVEEVPYLAGAARDLGPAVCLPFFALSAGHVTGDIPAALAAAGFAGPILPPIGAHPGAAGLIAAAIAAA